MPKNLTGKNDQKVAKSGIIDGEGEGFGSGFGGAIE